jgi:hypothetical protein
MMTLILLFNELLPWLAPLAVSSVTGGVVGYGSFRFAQGTLQQRIRGIERDVVQLTEECDGYVTRNEFDLIRDYLKEIQQDVREVRRSLTK